MSISAVILAGGKSSRMGKDKALLPFGDYSTLSEYQYRKLEPLFENVYLSAKEDKFPFKANIIYDIYEEYNPLNALISAFKQIDCDAIFLTSVDMPLLEVESISSLIDAYKYKRGLYRSFSLVGNFGVEPTATIYTRELLNEAESMYKECDYKLKNIILSKNSYKINAKNRELFNINRKEEYKKALKIVK